MKKYLAIGLISVSLTACAAKDKQYYLTHPQALQEITKACPVHAPKGMTCQDVKDMAIQVNELAYQLQMSPQGFGSNILGLQETIAKQEQALTDDPKNKVLLRELVQNRQSLAQHLAMVKWLESPES